MGVRKRAVSHKKNIHIILINEIPIKAYIDLNIAMNEVEKMRYSPAQLANDLSNLSVRTMTLELDERGVATR